MGGRWTCGAIDGHTECVWFSSLSSLARKTIQANPSLHYLKYSHLLHVSVTLSLLGIVSNSWLAREEEDSGGARTRSAWLY